MKTKLMIGAAMALLVAGCSSTGPLSGFGAAGESWEFIMPVLTVNGPTVTIKADKWTHIGTNGWPVNITNVVIKP